MKKILQLWLGIALVFGMMSTSVQAVDPNDEAEETEPAAAAAASPQASNSPTLAGWPKEVIDRIVSFLDPTSAARLAGASKEMARKVGDARIHHLKKALYQESQESGGHKDPTGKALPYMGLAFFDSEAPASRIGEALAFIPPQDRDKILKGLLGPYKFFAAKGGSRLANVAGTIEGLQHENMYRLILQALGEDTQDLTSVQKAALQHQFLGYDVYYTTEDKKNEWVQAFRDQVWNPRGHNGLQTFLDTNYQAITAETQAIDTDHYWVVQHSQLAGLKDRINRLLPENAEGPHPTVVMDINAAGPVFTMSREELPDRLRNLVLTNADESVQIIGDHFLSYNKSLQTVHLYMPALTNVGYMFMSFNIFPQTVHLYAPVLTSVGDDCLSWNKFLQTVHLYAPALTNVGDRCLNRNAALQTVHLYAPALKSVGRLFLNDNAALQTVHLYAPVLTNVGDQFIHRNDSLQTVHLYAPVLTRFGKFCLSYNKFLQTVHLYAPALTRVGDCCLSYNDSLQTVHLYVPALTNVGDFFLHTPVLANVGHFFFSFSKNLQRVYVPADQLERLMELFPECYRELLRPAAI
ncbi:MAG: hypothetical protein CMM87_03535 [Rickettsiales bacterium]|nr:hypothetical protein [Rickettsiales bacterium]